MRPRNLKVLKWFNYSINAIYGNFSFGLFSLLVAKIHEMPLFKVTAWILKLRLCWLCSDFKLVVFGGHRYVWLEEWACV